MKVFDPLAQFEPYLSIILGVVALLAFTITFIKAKTLMKAAHLAAIGIIAFVAYYAHPDLSISAFRLMFLLIAMGYIVTISIRARNAAEALGVSEEKILDLAKQRENMGKAGFRVPHARLANSDVVGEFEETAEGARMVDVKRDHRHKPDGSPNIYYGAEEEEPEVQKSSSSQDRKKREKEQATKKAAKADQDRALRAQMRGATAPRAADPRSKTQYGRGGAKIKKK